MQWLRRFIARNPAKIFRDGPEPITMGIKEHEMSWAVSVMLLVAWLWKVYKNEQT